MSSLIARNLHRFILRKRLFSSSTIPIVEGDSTREMYAHDHTFYTNNFAKYRDDSAGMFGFSSLGMKYVCPFKEETVKQIYQMDAQNKLVNSWPPTWELLLGEHAMTYLNGKRHKKIRKAFQPLFTAAALKNRVGVVKDATNTLLDDLMSPSRNGDDDYHNVYKVARSWTYSIAMNIILGDKIASKEQEKEIFENFFIWMDAFMDMDGGNANIPGTLLYNGITARNKIIDIIKEYYQEGVRQYNDGSIDSNISLYQLIKNEMNAADEDKHTEEELADNLLTLIWASHDTTATSTCNLIYCLYQYRDHDFVKNKLIPEIDEADFDSLLDSQILTAFVDETLRNRPVVASILKRLVSDEVMKSGHLIEKGTIASIPIHGLSKCPHIFGDTVNEFDPQRFIDDSFNKYTWAPFGAGVKMCLGWNLAYLELKLLTIVLVKECRFELDESRFQKAQSIFNFIDIFAKVYSRKD